MILDMWAQRWGITPEALADLRASYLGQHKQRAATVSQSMSEASVSQRTELNFSGMGGILWRNNVGVLQDDRGVPIRYGLANTSKKINKVTKSGDLIGCYPVVIRPEHVGRTFGLFTSIETKRAGWKWKGDAHELAQANWGEIVVSLGGVAMFLNDPVQINYMGDI